MRVLRVIVTSLIVVLSMTSMSLAQDRSDKIKPHWISKPPVALNDTYFFVVTEVAGAATLDEARMQSKKELSAKVEIIEDITIVEEYDEKSSQRMTSDGNLYGVSDDTYRLQIESEGHTLPINYKKITEYWETDRSGSLSSYTLYTLYAVAHKGRIAQFDDISITSRYGFDAFALSFLVPGAGQMYKGSIGKGIGILSGAVAASAAIVLCENTRASYIKKMKEQPRYAAVYNSRADSWETGRNVAIGVAAALYVYNLIDVLVTDGASRVKVRRKSDNSLTMLPALGTDYAGISLIYNF